MKTNNIPNIKEVRYWSFVLVKSFCRRNAFYTCGDVSDFDEMISFVKEHEPTTENLFIVARNIMEHSDAETNAYYAVSDIMVLLDRETVCLDYLF